MEREKEEPVKAAAVEAVSPVEKAAKIEVGKSFFSFSFGGGVTRFIRGNCTR